MSGHKTQRSSYNSSDALIWRQDYVCTGSVVKLGWTQPDINFERVTDQNNNFAWQDTGTSTASDQVHARVSRLPGKGCA